MDALREHFLAATRQEICPFGDDAIEWDYSRYSRALGMTALPGLQDYPQSGAALLGASHERWPAIEARYRGWCEMPGWNYVRVSARASVMAPDGFVHGLAVAMGGVDTPLFLRSGLGGRTAAAAATPVASRRRSAVMSMPLTSGERWLIASDRLRRRVRSEIASGGMLLMIEEAEKLTAAALHIIGHLLDAHRGWRARMLSRDARIYLVLLTTPEHQEKLHIALKRYQVLGECLCATEEEMPESGAPSAADRARSHLTAEDEHMLSALMHAPLVLEAGDIARLFGDAALARANELVKCDALRHRREYGKSVYAPNPVLCGALPPPPERVLRALFDRWRERSRGGRGHAHIHAALAALAFRFGDDRRALACLGRTGHGDNATLSLDLLEELDARLEALSQRDSEPSRPNSPPEPKTAVHESQPEADSTQRPLAGHPSNHLLRTGTAAAWLAWHAHQCNYDRAKAIASHLSAIPIRDHRDLYRTVTHILCTGRTHLDRTLPESFWASLSAPSLDPSFLDATFILADLFARLRVMSESDILERYEVVVRTFDQPSGGNLQSVAGTMLRLLVSSLAARLFTHVRDYINPSVQCRSALERALVALHAGTVHNLPAYVSGTLGFAELQSEPGTSTAVHGRMVLGDTLVLVSSTGNPRDLVPQLSCQFKRALTDGRWLLQREIPETLLLMQSPDAPRILAQRLRCTLRLAAGPRARISSIGILTQAWARMDASESPVSNHEPTGLAWELLHFGDYRASREAIDLALSATRGLAIERAFALFVLVAWSRASLSWHLFDELSARLSDEGRGLPEPLAAFLFGYLQGSRLLAERQLVAAAQAFGRAADQLKFGVQGEVLTMKRSAQDQARIAAFLAEHKSKSEAYSSSARCTLRALLAGLRRRGCSGAIAPVRGSTELLYRLDALLIGLDAWAADAHHHRDKSVLLMLWLRTRFAAPLAAVGTDLLEVVRREAQRLMGLLMASLGERFGDLLYAKPAAERLDAVLAIHATSLDEDYLEEYIVSQSGRLLGRNRGIRLIGRSDARVAIDTSVRWQEDPSLFGPCLAELRRARAARSQCWSHFTSFAHTGLTGSALTVERIALHCDGRSAVPTASVLTCRDGAQMPQSPSSTKLHSLASAGRGANGPGAALAALVGSSEAMMDLKRTVDRAAQCSYPVLIIGESGTGKELVARAIHEASRVRRGEWVVADVSTIPDSLLQSQLFGHARGAFTGAHEESDGLLAAANNTTLFLDEIMGMSHLMQASMLRALETGEYRSLGSTELRVSRFRLICSTRPGIQGAIERGEFRQDLYYRLSTFAICIPPLRERAADAREIAEMAAARAGATLSAGALRVVREYHWPGNVRQLLHAVHVALATTDDSCVTHAAMRRAISGEAFSASILLSDSASHGNKITAEDVVRRLGEGGESFTASELAKAASVSKRSAQRLLGHLVGRGIITRQGGGRGTRYRVATRP